jgi:DNA repair protein RecO (recombination protein O)
MPHTYSTQAIILKRIDYSEADRILTILTPAHGKFSAIAKGIRKPSSTLAGNLELLACTQVHIAMGRSLDILVQAEAKETFLAIRNDLIAMTYASYIAEIADKFLAERAPQMQVYQLLHDTLYILNAYSNEQQYAQDATLILRRELLLHYFEIHTLRYLGYAPNLSNCAQCQREIQAEENAFTPTLSGILCPNCRHYSDQRISIQALKVLRLCMRTRWEEIPALRVSGDVLHEVGSITQSLIRYHLERDLKSWEFFDMIHEIQ